MKWYQVKKSEIALRIDFKIFRIQILKRGLPYYKYLLPVVQIMDD